MGVAKDVLVGAHEEVGSERGACTALRDGDEVIGAVVRTRADVKPVAVSVGHRIDLQGAIDIALECAPRYRMPETTRCADRLASAARG
jgi:deoxyribonuclease V